MQAAAKYHEADIRNYFRDAFGYTGSIEESAAMTALFAELGADMYFAGGVSVEAIKDIDVSTGFSLEETAAIVRFCLGQNAILRYC